MSEVDYYRLLGVKPGATREEIRRAYRRLARRIHPDANPPGEDDEIANRRMAQLNEAYAVLRDPSQRAAYDTERGRKAADKARRTWAYDQAWHGTYGGSVHRPAQEQRPDRIVFQPALEQQLTLGFWAMLLAVGGLVGINLAVQEGTLLGAAMALGGFLGSALIGMAAVPHFQGYIVLTPESMIVYPVFGFPKESAYPYSQICDLHWQVRRRRYGGSVVRIMIDYFERDRLGRLNTTCYQSKWLMRVGDPGMLYDLLRTRITAHKYPYSRPTWRAVVVGAKELIQLILLAFCVVLVLAFRQRSGT
jgi:hypothetical protein